MYSANGGAWLASSAWAHRWWLAAIDGFNEVLFPGTHRHRRSALAGAVAGRGDAAAAAPRRRDCRATSPASTWLLALLAFWASFGPDAGLYRAALRHGADLRVPAGAGPHGHRWSRSRSSCCRARALGAVAARRPAAGLDRRPGRARRRARAEHGAAHRAARGAAGARGLPRAGARCRAGRWPSSPYFYAAHRLPAARRVHARLDLPLAAARQRLQRLTSRRDLRDDGRAAQLVPDPRVVPHPERGRRALRGLPPERLQTGAAARDCSSGSAGTSSSSARSCSRTTCGSTKSSTGPTSAVRGAGRRAHLAAGGRRSPRGRGSTTPTRR